MEYTDKYFKNIINNNTLRVFNYNFLDDFDDYLPNKIIYNYCLSKINYKLKNIWNDIVLKWIQVNKKLNNNKNFKKSIYFNQKYNFHHEIINDEKLNELLNDFINNDILKVVFVIECINCL